jgi:hypothetical protein
MRYWRRFHGQYPPRPEDADASASDQTPRSLWQRVLDDRRAAWHSIWVSSPAPPRQAGSRRDRGIAMMLTVILGPLGLIYVRPRSAWR